MPQGWLSWKTWTPFSHPLNWSMSPWGCLCKTCTWLEILALCLWTFWRLASWNLGWRSPLPHQPHLRGQGCVDAPGDPAWGPSRWQVGFSVKNWPVKDISSWKMAGMTPPPATRWRLVALWHKWLSWHNSWKIHPNYFPISPHLLQACWAEGKDWLMLRQGTGGQPKDPEVTPCADAQIPSKGMCVEMFSEYPAQGHCDVWDMRQMVTGAILSREGHQVSRKGQKKWSMPPEVSSAISLQKLFNTLCIHWVRLIKINCQKNRPLLCMWLSSFLSTIYWRDNACPLEQSCLFCHKLFPL